MLRFLGYLLVFLIGGVIGATAGGLFGGAAGSYLGACKVIDSAVESGALSQEGANATMRHIASDIGVRPEDKTRILDALKRTNQPPSACSKAIEAL